LRWLIATVFGPSAKEKRQMADEKNWATGARGEQLLAAALARECPSVLMLHDRRIPNSRANIDHIAVTATGVYVIDAKRYRGAIGVVTPLFGASKLKIDGRDQTKLVDGLIKQIAVVQDALADVAPKVVVHEDVRIVVEL
jgi:hypothetical protein